MIFIAFILITLPFDTDCSTATWEQLRQTSAQIEMIDAELSGKTQYLEDKRSAVMKTFIKSCLITAWQNNKLAPTNEKETHLALNTLSKIFFYSGNKDVLKIYAELASQVSKANPNYQSYIESLQKKYAANFAFDDYAALTLEEGLKEIISVKSVHGSSLTNNALAELINADSILVKDIDINDGSKIIVVGSPFCAFSNSLITWLRQSSNLKNSIYANNFIWVIKQNSSPLYEDILSYNQESSFVNYQLVYDRSKWDLFSVWDTPTIYFYKNGKLKHQLVGWPHDGREDSFYKGLALVGLEKEINKNPAP